MKLSWYLRINFFTTFWNADYFVANLLTLSDCLCGFICRKGGETEVSKHFKLNNHKICMDSYFHQSFGLINSPCTNQEIIQAIQFKVLETI